MSCSSRTSLSVGISIALLGCGGNPKADSQKAPANYAQRICSAIAKCDAGLRQQCDAAFGAALVSEECATTVESATCNDHTSASPPYVDTCFPPCNEPACFVFVNGCSSVVQNGEEVSDFRCGTVLTGTHGGTELCIISESCSTATLVTPGNCLEESTTYSCLEGCGSRVCSGDAVTGCMRMDAEWRQATVGCREACALKGLNYVRCDSSSPRATCQCE
jgi:hypothetical protein